MSYTEFRNDLKSWVKLDEKQNKYQNKLNKIRNTKNLIKPNIVSYMKRSNVTELPINSDFKLKCKDSYQYNFLNKEHLTNVLLKYIGNSSQVKTIVDDIYKSRQRKNIIDISITKKQ